MALLVGPPIGASDGASDCDPQREIERLLIRGEILVGMGEFAEAKEVFQVVVEQDPESVEAHNNLAVVQVALGAYPAAVAGWRALLEMQPDLEIARHNLNGLIDLLASTAAETPVQADALGIKLMPSACSATAAKP